MNTKSEERCVRCGIEIPEHPWEEDGDWDYCYECFEKVLEERRQHAAASNS